MYQLLHQYIQNERHHVIYHLDDNKKVVGYIKHSPDAFSVNESGESFQYHQITNQYLQENGKDIKEVMNYWSNINECTRTESQNLANIDNTDNSYVKLDKKTDCYNNHEVWLYTVFGGGHTWPGAWGNMDISASEEIWKFFSRYIE